MLGCSYSNNDSNDKKDITIKLHEPPTKEFLQYLNDSNIQVNSVYGVNIYASTSSDYGDLIFNKLVQGVYTYVDTSQVRMMKFDEDYKREQETYISSLNEKNLTMPQINPNIIIEISKYNWTEIKGNYHYNYWNGTTCFDYLVPIIESNDLVIIYKTSRSFRGNINAKGFDKIKNISCFVNFN